MELGLILLAAAVVLAAFVLAVTLKRATAAADPRLDAVIAVQGNIAGQFQQTVAAQAELQRTLAERIDALNHRLGESLSESAAKTAETLGSIGERLNTIDQAQKTIAELSGQVVALNDILSDKQARGAFGQERMEAIIADQLAPSLYVFQHTLSNGSRPDCVIRLPNTKAVLVLDSKFPLEAFEALKSASDDERKQAAARLRNDVQKHVGDIAAKYLIPGETQSPALMFVPSESIYAELHAGFSDLVQKARQQNVVIVSPHVLMLAVNTIQWLTRDAKMREQAGAIQKEVGALLEDVRRLGERVGKLRDHFDQTNKDIGQIEASMKGIDRHAERIAQVELGDDAALPAPS